MHHCPLCHSNQIVARNLARKTAGTLGTVAGVAGGLHAAKRGANLGLRVGLVAGPQGRIIVASAGAIAGVLLWGVMGGKAGATLGKVVDETILDNLKCLNCGHRFSLTPDPLPLETVIVVGDEDEAVEVHNPAPDPLNDGSDGVREPAPDRWAA